MSDRRSAAPRPEEDDFGSDKTEMRIGFGVSVAAHSAIVALLVFGIPFSTQPKPAIEQIVPVDFVTIAEKPAAPKIEPPKPTPPKPPEPPKEAKQEPPPPIPPPPPPPPPPPQETKQPDPPKVEPPKPEPPPPPKPVIAEAPKPEPKKPDPPKPPEPKKVEVKPPPKAEPKKEPPKKDDFLAVEQALKSLNKPAPAQPQLAPPQPRATPQPPPQQTALNYAAQLTGSELDGVREQFKPCWNPNFGGRNAAELVVEVEIYANPDGTIAQARPRPNIRMASDPFYQSAVDAAMRAVLRPQCGGINQTPLRLPREKYDQWKAFVLVFDPKAMLGM